MRPTSRVVLLKAYGPDGFSFYTNYNSRKGRELQENPYACMLFYWPVVDRQVRVEGKVSKLPQEAAVKYWNSRPLASRIGSKSSEQSTVIPNREVSNVSNVGLLAISLPTFEAHSAIIAWVESPAYRI
ncbi:pyridoxamine 5'-phosphate oxidase family protein [Cooperia oncophora]